MRPVCSCNPVWQRDCAVHGMGVSNRVLDAWVKAQRLEQAEENNRQALRRKLKYQQAVDKERKS